MRLETQPYLSIGIPVSGGTVGSVLFVGAGGLVAEDNAQFFWDDGNNRLGLGTTTPGANVHLVENDVVSVRLDSYVGSGSPSAITLYKARGTAAAPRRAQADDNLGRYSMFGAFAADDVTDATFPASPNIRMVGFAAENQTVGAQGATWYLSTVNIGTTDLENRLGVDSTQFRYHGKQRTTDYQVGLYAYNTNNTGSGGINGTDLNQMILQITAQVDKSGAITNYANPILRWAFFNELAAPGEIVLSESGWEGRYSDGAVLDPTTTHWYHYDSSRVLTVQEWAPFGVNTAAAGLSPMRFPDVGVVISGVAGDYGTANSFVAGSLTVNNTTTAPYWGLRVKPTFNTGGSNLNKTVYLGDFDSTNTAVTGLTVNLLRLGYGGTQKFLVDATGLLTTAVAIPVTSGGTGLATGTSGGVLGFTAATTLASSAAGTTGQALISGGTAIPTWFAPTAGSILFAGTSGVLAQDNSALFWDNTNDRLGIGINAPTQPLHVVAAAGTNTSANFDQYSANATGPSFRGRKFRGSLAAPRRANTNDVLFAVNASGGFAADDASTATAGSDVGQFRFRASENYTSTNQGAYFEVRTTPIGTTGVVTRLTIDDVGGFKLGTGTVLAWSVVAPTVSSGFGSSPSIAANNGTTAFTVNVGTGGTASSGVIGMPTATTGWICHCENRTAVAANRGDQRTVQTATSTTSVTVQNQTISTGAALAWTASDILTLACVGY